MLSSDIKSKALRIGYTSCGIIPAAVFEEYERYLDERVKSYPGSKELYQMLYKMARPPEGGKSVIVCSHRYNKYRLPVELDGLIGKCYLYEYRLPYSPEHRAKDEFEAYLHTLGVRVLEEEIPLRWAAVKAGLGKFGRNTFIYTPEAGSYVQFDAWVVDTELDYDPAPEDIYMPECGEDCQKCVQACPTNALADGFSMDRGKCVAHTTTRGTDGSDEEALEQMGAWIYGCDMCQDACPRNADRFTEKEEFPLLAEHEKFLSRDGALDIDEDTYANAIFPHFWYTGKDGLWKWHGNALRSMVNSGDPAYHERIKKARNHEDVRVRAIAEWGCRKLGLG